MKIIFCCTGNTCRSPMAEYLFRDMLDKAGYKDIEVGSVGLAGFDGEPISRNSELVLNEMGIDASGHRSKCLTLGDVVTADYIFTMTKGHSSEIKRAIGDLFNVMSLGEAVGGDDVSDPYGGDIYEYRYCRDEIIGLLNKLLAIIPDLIKKKENESK